VLLTPYFAVKVAENDNWIHHFDVKEHVRRITVHRTGVPEFYLGD